MVSAEGIFMCMRKDFYYNMKMHIWYVRTSTSTYKASKTINISQKVMRILITVQIKQILKQFPLKNINKVIANPNIKEKVVSRLEYQQGASSDQR